MGSRFEEVYRVGPDSILTEELLNRIFRDLDDRLAKAEVVRLSEDQAFSIVLDRVLARSEGVISSLRDQLLALTELQWLTAQSDTARTLEVGATFAFEIIEADRELFVPGPFALLAWTGGDPEDYAIVKTLAFDRGLGQWDVRVEAFVGDPGPHAEWQISAVAGATLAQLALLDQGQGVLQATEAARDVVVPKHQEVVEKHAEVMPAAEQAATARDQAVTAAAGLFPWGFSQDGVFWTAEAAGSPAELQNYAAEGAAFVTEAAYGRVLQSNGQGQVAPRGAIAPVPGRRYRAEVRARVKTNKTVGGGAAALSFVGLDAAFATPVVAAAEIEVVAGLPSSKAAFTVADGVLTFALDYVAPANPPPYLRPRFSWNQAGGDAVVQILSFLIHDATAAYDAEALAQSLDTAAIDDRLDALEDGSAFQATAAQTRAGTDPTVFPSAKSLTDSAAPVPVAFAANLVLDLDPMNIDVAPATSNFTLANPINAKPGKSGRIRLQQDAVGGRTIAYGLAWMSAGGPQALSTGPNAIDGLDYLVGADGTIEYSLRRDIK